MPQYPKYIIYFRFMLCFVASGYNIICFTVKEVKEKAEKLLS